MRKAEANTTTPSLRPICEILVSTANLVWEGFRWLPSDNDTSFLFKYRMGEMHYANLIILMFQMVGTISGRISLLPIFVPVVEDIVKISCRLH